MKTCSCTQRTPRHTFRDLSYVFSNHSSLLQYLKAFTYTLKNKKSCIQLCNKLSVFLKIFYFLLFISKKCRFFMLTGRTRHNRVVHKLFTSKRANKRQTNNSIKTALTSQKSRSRPNEMTAKRQTSDRQATNKRQTPFHYIEKKEKNIKNIKKEKKRRTAEAVFSLV